MADGKVKRGFGKYLLILILIIIAAFLITIVVMMFSPFKNVLGFQYLVYNIDDEVFQTANEETIDFTNVNEVIVNCNYASVTVARSLDVGADAVRIENSCKGFARSSDNTSFTYDIYYSNEGSILNIDVSEPDGFLFFDKQINISLLLPARDTYSFDNTKITVINTSGNVYIGNQTRLTDQEATDIQCYINVNSIDVKTNSGIVYLYPFLDKNLNDLSIKSSSGRIINFLNEITISNTFEIHTDSSIINLNNVVYNGVQNIIFDINEGQLFADSITGNIDLNIASGYLDIVSLTGSISANNSVNQLDEARITINRVDGNISLPFANSSRINLGTVAQGNQVYIDGFDCQVNIEELRGKAFIKTTSGNVNVHIYEDDLDIETTSGNISVTYECQAIEEQLDFKTDSGDINLRVLSNLAYQLFVYDGEGKLRDNSNIDIASMDGNFEIPVTVNGGTTPIMITSNAHINISLIEL